MTSRFESLDSTDVKRLIDLGEQVGVSDSYVEKLVGLLGATGDKRLAEQIEQTLILSNKRKLSHPLTYRPGKKNPFTVGKSKHGYWAGLTREELNRNLLAVGETGSGKTVFFYYLMAQLMNEEIPFWAFDFKQDYRHLLRRPNTDELLVIPWEDLKFNPLRPPPGVAPIRWMQVFANCFSDSQGFLTASKYFLMSRVYSLYNLYGVLDGNHRYPSLHELAETLQYERQPLVTKQARYLETTINRVRALGLAIGDMLDCERGYPLENLLTKPVVFELEGLAEEIQNFLVEILLVWIYFYRMAQGHRGRLRHCIFFDEARKIFNKNKERRYESGIPIIDYITAKTREFGEAFIIADQELTKLTDSIKANCYSIVGLPLGSGKDIRELSQVMGLDSRQVNRLYDLSIGQGVFKKSGQRPLRVDIPFHKIDKGVSTEEVKERMREPIKRLNREVKDRWRPKSYQKYIQQLAGAHKIKKSSLERINPHEGSEKQLSPAGEKLFMDIAKKPFKQLADRYQSLGLSGYKGNRARKELLSLGYLKEIEINLGKGGRPKFFELTPEGEVAYKNLNPQEPYLIKGEGSFEHRFWQHKISQYFKGKYYQTFIEFRLGESQLDVFATSDGEKIGVEVALSPKGEVDNIKKDLQVDLDQLILACKNPGIMSKIGKKVRDKLGEKKVKQVRFLLVTHFLN